MSIFTQNELRMAPLQRDTLQLATISVQESTIEYVSKFDILTFITSKLQSSNIFAADSYMRK